MVGTRSVKKNNQREVIQKVRKGERSFLHATCRLDLIHIVIKFHRDILKAGFLVMICIKIV